MRCLEFEGFEVPLKKSKMINKEKLKNTAKDKFLDL